MTTREHVYAINRVPFQGPPSPNNGVDEIMVEVRIFYPHNAGPSDLVKPFLDTVHEAAEQLSAKLFPEPVTPDWLLER